LSSDDPIEVLRKVFRLRALLLEFEMDAFEQKWDEWRTLNQQIDAALAHLREATARSDLDQMKCYRADLNTLCSERIRAYMHLQTLAAEHA
jgi:hypothetical protein